MGVLAGHEGARPHIPRNWDNFPRSGTFYRRERRSISDPASPQIIGLRCYLQCGKRIETTPRNAVKTPCKHPGCNALLDKRGYCEAHHASAPKPRENYDRWRKRDPKQARIDAFRSTAAWQNVRRLKMAANPLCEDPFGEHARSGATTSTRQIHHIEPLATPQGWGRRLTWENLMGVCTACHARLEHPSPSGGGLKV